MAHTYSSLQVGDEFSCGQFISEDDVATFARITGDDNPIHLDEAYARESRVGMRVVHGVLLLGVISKVLGHDFPGPGSIAVALSARFLRPVPVGSDVEVRVKIVDKVEARRQVKAKVYLSTGGKLALGGDATILPPDP